MFKLKFSDIFILDSSKKLSDVLDELNGGDGPLSKYNADEVSLHKKTANKIAENNGKFKHRTIRQ